MRPLVTDGRRRIAGAFTALCLAALGGSVLSAAPSTAEPTISDVRERVDRLYHEAEQASERYNDARIRLREARSRLVGVQAALDRQRERVDTVRDQVVASVVAQYQSHALSTTSQVLLSEDPQSFLGQLARVSEYNAQQARVIDDLTREGNRLARREEVAQRETESIARTKETLAEEKAVVEERAAEAESLLGRLEEDQRTERASRSAVRVPVTEAPGSGSAAAAVSYAMGQVGNAYVYGAAGPSAFDCSGLTMMAWAQAGVALPHSSSAQMGSGTPVSISGLRPGDLVFYYSPVSHVGIYIGNGMIAHAANPSTGVRVDPVTSMPFSGAVRPG